MAYITTFTGINFDVENYTEDDIVLEDIAHSLSMKVRWNGHIPVPFTIAQHSVYTARTVDYIYKDLIKTEKLVKHLNRLKKICLMHDGSEYVLQGMATPFKRILPDYQKLENNIQNCIYNKFDCVPTEDEHDILKLADDLMLCMEGMMFIKNWDRPIYMKEILSYIDPYYHVWGFQEAKENFLKEYERIFNFGY